MDFTRDEWLIIIASIKFRIKKAHDMGLATYTEADEALLLKIMQHFNSTQE